MAICASRYQPVKGVRRFQQRPVAWVAGRCNKIAEREQSRPTKGSRTPQRAASLIPLHHLKRPKLDDANEAHRSNPLAGRCTGRVRPAKLKGVVLRIKDAFVTPHITLDDLDGKCWDLEIARVFKASFKQDGRQAEEWRIIFQKGKKYLRLSRRLAKDIAAILGTDEMDNWSGKRIAICPGNVTAYGKTKELICVRAAKPVVVEATPSSESSPASVNTQAA